MREQAPEEASGSSGHFKRRALALLFPSAATMSASQALIPALAALLARTDDAEDAISGFAVAFSIALLAGLPQLRVQQLTLVFLKDSTNLPTLRKFVLQWAVVSTGVILLVAFTPLNSFVLNSIFSLDSAVADQAASALKALVPLPGLLVMRSHLHGVALRAEKPLIVWTGTLIGSAAVVSIAAALITQGSVSGATAGGIAFSAGVAVEALTLIALTRRVNILDTERRGKDVTHAAMVSFFWPLLISALLPAITQPVINAGMARAAEPTVSIAAVSIAFGLFQTVSAATNGVQAATLALLALRFREKQTLLFMLSVGFLTTVVTASIGFIPPVTRLVLQDVLGAENRMLDLALLSFQILTFLPIAMVIEQFYASRLMRERDTRPIIYINLIRMAVLIGWVSITLTLTDFSGAVVGAGAVAITLFIEAGLTFLFSARRHGRLN